LNPFPKTFVSSAREAIKDKGLNKLRTGNLNWKEFDE